MASAAGATAPQELTALMERMGVPCAVVDNAAQGKHVQATADLAAGTTLFEEKPIAAWPLHPPRAADALDAQSFCDACFAWVGDEHRKPCGRCGDAVYCSDECRGRQAIAHSFVCGELGALRAFHVAEAAKHADGVPPPISVESIARCVATMAARYLQLRRQYPDLSAGELFTYAAHSFNRLLEPPLTADFEDADPVRWAGAVRAAMQAKVEATVGAQVAEGLLSDETLRTVLGELTINGQGLAIKAPAHAPAGVRPTEAAGVFTLQSCFNHSCTPNAAITSSTNSDISVDLLAAVAKGEEITISYLPRLVLELEPYTKRRERLRSYFFTCACKRCAAEEAAAKGSTE